MGCKSFLRGHEIEFSNKGWVYSDTGESTILTYKDRSCGNCGNPPTDEGHDSCLGTLNDVMNACCGHGIGKKAYIQFLDGHSIHGHNAIIILSKLKGEGE